METKSGAATKTSSHDFEPTCNWEREEGHDTLIVDVPDFKKGDLTIKFSAGTLTICGELPVIEAKNSRFQKQISIGKDFKPEDIHAKLVGSHLRISMPPSAVVQPSHSEFSLKSLVSSLKLTDRKVFAKVGIVVVVVGLVVYGAYITYKYQSCLK